MTIERKSGGPGEVAPGALLWPDQWWRVAAAALMALMLGVISAFSLAVAVIALGIFITLIVGWWARLHGDALVVAITLLVFWAPFHTTISRFNLSPQEVAVYFIILACLMLDRQGVWGWVKALFTSVPRVSLIAIGVFTLACLQSVAFESGVSALERLQALRSALLYPILFALLVTYTVRSRNVERALLKAFFSGAALFAAYALSLKLLGVDIANGAVAGRLGAESSFLSQYHPNNIGLYLALALPFAVPLWHEAGASRILSRMKRAGIIVSALLMALDIILAASRGTLVALAISVVVALIFLLWQGTATQRVIVGAVIFGAAAGAASLALGRQTAALGRYALLLNPSALLANPNVQFRLQLYARAFQLIRERPLTGIGLQAFSATGTTPFSPHDTYLDLWVSVGIFGLLAFVFALAHGIWTSLRWARHYARNGNQAGVYYSLSIVLAIVAFTTQGLVEAYDEQPRIAPVIWMLALIAQAAVFSRVTPKAAPLAPLEPTGVETEPGLKAPVPGVAAPPLGGEREPDEWRAGRRVWGQDARTRVDFATSAPPQTEWNEGSQTGPPPSLDEESHPVIQDDPFQISSEFEAAVLQAEARVIQRAAASGELTLESINALRPGQTAPPRPVPSDQGMAYAPPAPPLAREAPLAPRPETSEADALLKRAPGGYLWNQIYSLLIFGLNFALSIVIARGLGAAEFGIYAILSSIVSALLLLFAFGLEDAASVFVPRLLARDGRAGAARLIRRLLLLRTLVMVGVGALLALGLPLVAGPAQVMGIVPPGFAASVTGSAGLRASLMGVYLAGSAIVALQGAFFASVLKTGVTLIIGGASQVIGALLTLALLGLGYGIDGIFAAQAIAAWLAVLAFLIVLAPYLLGRAERVTLEGSQIRSLMVSAWLTNVSNGALGKQMDIILMSFFAVSYVAIGYYNLAYQLVSIVSVLLISGLGGVGVAAMSVAYTARGPGRLASMWRAMLTLHLLLALPLQILTFALADQIILTIYGAQYAGVIPLLRIFLAFSILGRILGGGASQSALYVLGRQRFVLNARYTGLVINLMLDVLLIQLAGPAGALVATGFSQLWVGGVEFLMLRGQIANRYPLSMALRVIAYALIAVIPAVLLPVEGLAGLIARGALFVALFVAAILLFRLGDSRDIAEFAALNSRTRWLVSLVERFSLKRAWKSGHVA